MKSTPGFLVYPPSMRESTTAVAARIRSRSEGVDKR